MLIVVDPERFAVSNMQWVDNSDLLIIDAIKQKAKKIERDYGTVKHLIPISPTSFACLRVDENNGNGLVEQYELSNLENPHLLLRFESDSVEVLDWEKLSTIAGVYPLPGDLVLRVTKQKLEAPKILKLAFTRNLDHMYQAVEDLIAVHEAKEIWFSIGRSEEIVRADAHTLDCIGSISIPEPGGRVDCNPR